MAQAILSEPVVAGNPVPAVVSVDFHGFKIPTVIHDGQPHFAIKPICEAIGLDFSSQLRNIKRDAVLGTCVVKLTMQMPGDDQAREYAFLPVHFFNGWIFKIDANRYVIKTIRESIIMYQREGYDVLFAYFNRGIAVNPNAIQDAPAGPSLPRLTTAKERNGLAILVNKLMGEQGPTRPNYIAFWKRFHEVFGVKTVEEITVDQLPRATAFVEALLSFLEGSEPKPLSAPAPISTIRDYADVFGPLPDMIHWRALSHRLVRAHDAFQRELDAIKKDALRPFQENRRSNVGMFLDSATTAVYRQLFDIAEDGAHTAYRGAYGALLGLEGLHDLLVRG